MNRPKTMLGIIPVSYLDAVSSDESRQFTLISACGDVWYDVLELVEAALRWEIMKRADDVDCAILQHLQHLPNQIGAYELRLMADKKTFIEPIVTQFDGSCVQNPAWWTAMFSCQLYVGMWRELPQVDLLKFDEARNEVFYRFRFGESYFVKRIMSREPDGITG